VSDSNQFSLLGQRRFAPFFVTQFLGALNDNIFRNGLVILITFQGVRIAGMDAGQLANVAGALFILPFFLFSATAGQLADKYEKSRLMRSIKLLEIVLMVLAAFAFVTQSYTVLLVVLFLMGCQSTLFGPVKYAYLPQQLATDELVGGNALVESGTYMAIIFGLIVGGISVAADYENQSILASCLVVTAVFGYLASRQIPSTKPVDPDLKINWNAWTETWHIVGFAREERSVFLSILGISWFWFFGSAMTIQLPAYTLGILNGNEAITTALLVAFAVGVGVGSLLCERMSGHRIELGLVPFGSIGLSLFAIDLFFSQPDAQVVAVNSVSEFLARPGSLRILIDLSLLGAFGGFYSVPLYALIQDRTERQHLSRVIAANNIINALFMVAAAILAFGVLAAGLSIPQFYLILAVLNALVAIYIFTLLPEFLMRFLVWILINMLYRVRPTGLENIPDAGPAVLVCNHVSFVDALLVGGSIRRPVRFVMYYKIFQIPRFRSPRRKKTRPCWQKLSIRSIKNSTPVKSCVFFPKAAYQQTVRFSVSVPESRKSSSVAAYLSFRSRWVVFGAAGSAGEVAAGFARSLAVSGPESTCVSVKRYDPKTLPQQAWNCSYAHYAGKTASTPSISPWRSTVIHRFQAQFSAPFGE